MVERLSGLVPPLAALALIMVLSPISSVAAEFVVNPQTIGVMKSVFGQVQSRDLVTARARIGGTITAIGVEEGDEVTAGQVIATVVDDKLALQLGALEAQRMAISAQFDNAKENLRRTESLFARGTVAKARLDDAQTQVDVLTNQIGALDAEIAVNRQRTNEGEVEAPDSGRVLSVPVTKGSVVLPGETVVRIAVGGYFLRLSIPERHAATLQDGGEVLVGRRGITPDTTGHTHLPGRIAKIYPEIVQGRVIADVEVGRLGDFFVGERTLVSIPIGERDVIAVPPDAVSMRHGIDYVTLIGKNGTTEISVVPGEVFQTKDGPRIEILTGLAAGDRILIP